MRSRLARSLFEMFRGTGRDAPLAELQKSGLKSVTLLGADQLAVLVEQALDRALEVRVLELSDPERAHLLERAHDEFEALRAQIQGLEGDAEKKRRELTDVESRLAGLHGDFQRANATLDAEILAASRAEPTADRDPSQEFAALYPVVVGAGVNDPVLAEKVTHAIARYLRVEREKAAQEAARLQRERIDLLERRLAKLNETLSRTEEDLSRALAAGGREEGVESIFRTVQGLRATAQDFQRKRAMLSDIFQKNLSLQKGAVTP